MFHLNPQRRLPPATASLPAILAPWLIFTGLMYLVSRSNYLLFHSLAELFGLCVAIAVFMLV